MDIYLEFVQGFQRRLLILAHFVRIFLVRRRMNRLPLQRLLAWLVSVWQRRHKLLLVR
jgi:hypothetical protein